MNKFTKLLTVELLRLISTIISLTIFINIIVNGAWTYLFPDSGLVRELNPVSLNFLLLIALLLISLGWLANYLVNPVKLISLRSLSRGEFFTYLVTAFFFAVFFNQTTSWLSSHRPYSIFLLTLVLLFLLPQWVNFYTTFNLTRWKKVFAEGKLLWQQEKEKISQMKPYRLVTAAIRFLSLIGKVAVILIVLLALSISTVVLVVKYLDYQEYLKTTQGMFYIKETIPKKTIYGEKVDIVGYNFGIRTEGYHYKIMSSYGEVGMHEWTPNKVSFIVPLHLKEASMYLWLERPEANQSGSLIIKSNEIIFTVVPREGFYPESLDDPKWKRGLRKLKRIIFVEKGLLYMLP